CVEKMRPGVGKADDIARIDSENGRQVGVVHAELHRLLSRGNHLHAASTMGLALRRRAGLLRPRQAREPWLDRGERTHEAACLQKLAAPIAARRQIAVESLLIDLVHMEEGIGGAIVESGILDVFADDARALLVAAAEKIRAGVMVRVVVGVLISVAVGLRHDDPLRKRPRAMPRQLNAICAIKQRAIETPPCLARSPDGGVIAASHKAQVALAYRERFQYHVTLLPSTWR